MADAAMCASRRLSQLVEDEMWGRLVLGRLSHLVALLHSAPAPPEWWAGRRWHERLAGLVRGLTFQAQVYNRELGDQMMRVLPHVDV
jgi:hypothetical protein